ncbi:MAG: PD-(D/E)XK nuclease family protein [Sulfuricurvum sp.]|uniref:PD-(D/E)XK nuclease family protein n=1 Tax=Sulfuricurvum sp. TaxID=2025608 RepID=UPI0026119299|nr:PD-(D/E)XK nuclease family protein [Sulfuricurvum sp.]MDD2828021.1 PD-(D/E)XK nuclease family protein [Sulfuricurvum sp.]MDD4948102.1 PD-(D/E)XK nuclease family protein [Sulfuricurvum sp.]
MQSQLIVFPTSRSIRETLRGYGDGFLPTTLGMGDFLDRSVRGGGKIVPDDDLRLLALHEATNFSAFDTLHIERNFFTFIQNSTYIFRFFEELSGEMVSIEALEGADVYGEYEEHIAILKKLWCEYQKIVDSRGWSDPIFSKSIIEINEGYLRGFEKITLHVEGYLSRYELEVLEACSHEVEVECLYHATTYNEKMSSRFREYGLEVEEGYSYHWSLSTHEVVSKVPLAPLKEMSCEIFQHRLTQIGFIKAQIQMMVEGGISPDQIVVVVPDESFVHYLRVFDTEGNLNFAMGESLERERVVMDIEAVELFIKEPSVENSARLSRIDTELVEWLKGHYYQPFVLDDLRILSTMMIGSATRDEVKSLIQEEVEKFKSIAEALREHEFKSGLRIFLSRLKNRTIDDVGGGKITVMGLLETRGVSYDGVIVVDFNEGYVPHRSQKDLFLNTKTRRIADLPTSYERESLQKHYYWMLFQRAQKVAIGCVQNTETIPSRFLLQLGIATHPAQSDFGEIVFGTVSLRGVEPREIEGRYDFRAHPLSSSGLKSFLTCKRQFYYKYIDKIKEHEQLQDLSKERDIGNALHNALERVYADKSSYESATDIKEALRAVLDEKGEKDAMERYTKALWIEKLDPFYEHEIARFEEGIRVAYHEKEARKVVEGIELVGRIDRIDRSVEGLEVLDYKTGQFADTKREPKEEDSDYQLSIYALLAEEFGKVSRCGYYDLQNGTIHYEQFLEEKIAKLREILQTLAGQQEWNWMMCEELKHCRYCPYATLCQRDL